MSPSQARAMPVQPAASTQPGALARDADSAPKQAGSNRISLSVARVEPYVAWSLAAYTAWLALFSFPDMPTLWLFVLYAGALGKWCHLFPSRQQTRMFVHGSLLVAAAYLLHTHAAGKLGGPGGIFFFWVAIPALAYAFMLKPRWGVALVGVALVEFAVAHLVLGSLGMTALAQAGFLLAFPLALALPFGVTMRKPDEQLELSRVDAATGLLNMQGLLVHGEQLLRACRREKRPVTLAVFGCGDLLAVRDTFGRRAARKSLAMLVAKFQALAGGRGLLARTGGTEFTLVLPGLNREKALQAIAKQLGNPLRIEFEVSGEEIVMTPHMVIETAGSQEASLEAFHADLCADLKELRSLNARNDEPATTQAAPLEAAGKPSVPFSLAEPPEGAFASYMPTTMPVALGAR